MDSASRPRPVSGNSALFLVSATSGLVLVIEILAGRLMAPYVGVSLDTFTGIIGTILAGIAAGAAVGGKLADRRDPMRLIGLALFFGGGLIWLSIPTVRLLGPGIGSGPVAIVILAGSAFFLPAAVLSGIGPMVAKLELDSLTETGSVVGRLSAASTFGALVGTFGTGFFLLSFLGVQTIILIVGALLVAGGVGVLVRAGQALPDRTSIAVVVIAAGIALLVQSPCDYSTDYYCVRVEPDSPTERSLIIDQLRHAHVDLEDPTNLDIRYMRLFADAVAGMPEGPLRVLHIGGGGFSLPRYINEVRPASTNTVLELDPKLVEIANQELGLKAADGIDIRTGDARLHLGDLPSDGFDLIVGDVFSGASVPWHLTTIEVVRELRRLLDSDGLYLMNVIDGGASRFARAQLSTLRQEFAELAVIEPAEGIGDSPVNQVLLASGTPIGPFEIDRKDGRRIVGHEVDTFIGDNGLILTDDYAPTDQLLQ